MIGNNFTDNSGVANPGATHFLHKVLRLLLGQTEKTTLPRSADQKKHLKSTRGRYPPFQFGKYGNSYCDKDLRGQNLFPPIPANR